MNFSDNESLILQTVALSPIPVTAYELSNTLGKDYSTIHKTCKKFIDAGIFETATETNDKNVQKKVIRYSLFGFCFFVGYSGFFSGFYDEKIQSEKIERCIFIIKTWGQLDEGIGCLHTMIMKYRDLWSKRGIEIDMIRVLGESCVKTVQFMQISFEHNEKIGKNPDPSQEARIVSIIFQRYLIEGALDLPLDIDSVVEVFKDSAASDELKSQMREKIEKGIEIEAAYKRFF